MVPKPVGNDALDEESVVLEGELNIIYSPKSSWTSWYIYPFVLRAREYLYIQKFDTYRNGLNSVWLSSASVILFKIVPIRSF